MSQEQGFLPAVIKGKIKEKGEHDMLFLSALELVQMCQKHGILIGTDCVIHFCDEQGTWHEMTHAGMAMELMQNAEETRKLLRELSKAGITFYFKGLIAYSKAKALPCDNEKWKGQKKNERNDT